MDVYQVIRPESVIVSGDESAPFHGTVRQASFVGPSIEYTIDTPQGELFAVAPATESTFAVGARVGIALLPHGLAVLPRDVSA